MSYIYIYIYIYIYDISNLRVKSQVLLTESSVETIRTLIKTDLFVFSLLNF